MRNSGGIALIITLSIMVLLTVALSQTFQDTALEIKMVKHEENIFTVQQMNRSLFRAFLMAIKSFGPNKVRKFIVEALPADVPVPITNDEEADDGYFQNPKILSLDHYYVLNTVAHDRGAGDVDRDILINILSKKISSNLPTSTYYSFIGSLADFIDQDEKEINKNFLIGQENYVNQEIDFIIKNNYFDVITELRILPKLHELNFDLPTMRSLSFPLRVHKLGSDGCKIGKFNLNFLPQNEEAIREKLYDFSSMFEGLYNDGQCQYEFIADKNNIDKIVDMVKEKFSSGLASSEFVIPLKNDVSWKDAISSIQVQQSLTSFIEFFSSRTELIQIKFEVLFGDFKIKNEAVLQLIYGSSSRDNDLPSEISVLYYKRS